MNTRQDSLVYRWRISCRNEDGAFIMLRRIPCIRREDKGPRATFRSAFPRPHATFLTDFMARRFQEAGISHRIDVSVDVAVEEK